MAVCEFLGCGKRLPGGVRIGCSSCGCTSFCSQHRLPEDHACGGLQHLAAERRKRLEGELIRFSTVDDEPRKRMCKFG